MRRLVFCVLGLTCVLTVDEVWFAFPTMKLDDSISSVKLFINTPFEDCRRFCKKTDRHLNACVHSEREVRLSHNYCKSKEAMILLGKTFQDI